MHLDKGGDYKMIHIHREAQLTKLPYKKIGYRFIIVQLTCRSVVNVLEPNRFSRLKKSFYHEIQKDYIKQFKTCLVFFFFF